MPLFDLASLTKPLVTAPLVLDRLDLDADRRGELGFRDRAEPLTARRLLCHSAGLPPWLPYTGEPLAEQLRRPQPFGAHPLLRRALPGRACYSDLGYRLLAELLERESGRRWADLGCELTALAPAPWAEPPAAVPAPGPDREAWLLAAPEHPFPPPAAALPHDANARAGMAGHAGFGADAAALERWLRHWVERYAARMAAVQAEAEDGTPWGLGLWRTLDGAGRFGRLLASLPQGWGIRVRSVAATALPPPAPAVEGEGTAGEWWMHTGFTGPLLLFRPADGACLCLLLHRAGPAGELLDAEALRGRRWAALEEAVA